MVTEAKRLTMIKEFRESGRTDNQKWRRHAVRAMKFYLGNQWSAADLEMLRQAKRPALTVNRLLPIINLLSGFQRQNRQDIKVYPRKSGQRQIAEVLTAMAKHAQDQCNAEYEHSMVFLMGLITGKGWLAHDIDYNNDPINGDLVMHSVNPFYVLEDRAAEEYDLNKSCKFIIQQSWMDKDELELAFPKKVRDIRGGGLEQAEASGITEADLIDDPDAVSEMSADAYVGKDRSNRYLVQECWWKTWEDVLYLIDHETMDVRRMASKATRSTIAEMMQAVPGRFEAITRLSPVLHLTTTAGDIILKDETDPLNGIIEYPLVRFCPYLVLDNIMGVVDNLIDPQQEYNKRRSQALHHLNQTSNSGWMYEEGSLGDEAKNNLADFGSTPGLNIEYRNGKPPVKIQPNAISTGHLQTAELSAGDLREISGANTDLMGYRSERAESGVAMGQRRDQGLLVNEITFDNFRYYQQICAQTLIELLRRGTGDRLSYLYTDQEIQAIIEESDLNINLEDLRSFKAGRYGIKISDSPSNPTARAARFQEMVSMVQAGIPIDPILLIESSDMSGKEAAVQYLKQQQAAAAAAQNPQNQLPPGPPAG